MKTTMLAILAAAALMSVSVSGIATAENVADGSSATSVADMLQKKQEHQLREQLVKDGRWDQVRQIDENNAERMREMQEARYTRVNEVLDRNGDVKVTSQGTPLDECGPEELKPR